MAASKHAGLIPSDEAKKLYSYPTLPGSNGENYVLLGNGQWGLKSGQTTGAAEKATKDGSDQVITSTYIKAIAKEGTTSIKLTKGDNTTSTVALHPTVAAGAGVPTANQTPAFGATFNVAQVAWDSLGHVTKTTTRTVKIPNSTASATANGLMTKELYSSVVGGLAFPWSVENDGSDNLVVKTTTGITVFTIPKAGEY